MLIVQEAVLLLTDLGAAASIDICCYYMVYNLELFIICTKKKTRTEFLTS